MRKEGFRGLYNSRDARVNIALFAAILVIFALTMVFVEAMTVELRTPGNLTFNTSTQRTINISFNATWSFGGATSGENVSNCSLFINSTTNAIPWDIVKNVSTRDINGLQGIDNFIQNGTTGLSYMRFNFSGDGNFTYSIGCLNFTNASIAASYTFGGNFTVFIDATPPRFNFTVPKHLFNTSTVAERLIEFTTNDSGLGLNVSLNSSINISIYLGGTQVAFFTYINKSSSTNLSCNATTIEVTTAVVTCNATYKFDSNGTYVINASAVDALGLVNFSTINITVDTIPPIITSLNFSNGTITQEASLGASTPATVPAAGAGTWAQGRRLFGIANVTDNLTAPLHAYLQFHNATSGEWTTVNTTTNKGELNISPSDKDRNGTVNLSYVVPTGHNVFEGANVSFRYLVNDTLGNINTSGNVINITIQINDTTKPTLELRVGSESGTLNNTNTTDTTPTVFWNITEGQALRNISIQFASQTDQDCLGLKLFAATANANRNGSITLKGAEDQAGCTALSNGTNTIRLTAEDTWGNQELYIHSITVDTGGPNITFNNTQHGIAPVLNLTNVTPYMGINITVVGVGQAAIKNISFTSSCNSTVQTVTNGTFIWPFNYSSGTCKDGVYGNRTVTVTSFDVVGNSQTKTLTFTVDDLGPSLSVASPTERSNSSNVTTITLSAKDGSQAIASFGYYLDDRRIVDGTLTILNLSNVTGTTGVNVTNTFNITFTPGTHKIKFAANDTLGNVLNSSIITFDVRGLIDLNALGLNFTINRSATTLSRYHYDNALNVSVVNLTNSSGITVNDFLNVSGRTLNLFMKIANTTKGINLSVIFNESAAVWDRYNFSIKQNDSTTQTFLTNNWTVVIQDYLFVNETIQEFLPDNESYYVSVNYPLNASSAVIGGAFEIWYFDDVKDFTTKRNVTKCADGFAPTLTFTTSSACWNHTDNQTISVLLPHFSALAFVNNTGTPNVNVTTPLKANQTISMFIPNITVSADAVTCYYHLNSSSPTNKTMAKSGNICLGDTERLKNLSGSSSYNATFWVIDDDGNTNKYVWEFNLSDSTPPNSPNSSTISTSVDSSTSATITISGINETVNATVFYATTVGGISASTSEVQTDFNQSQAVSLSSLTASQLYHFNVTICDFNGNCARNGTFNFTTSAAAAAAAAAAASSSGGGGGGAVTPTPGVATVAASTGTSWDSLAGGSSGTVVVKNDKIAVTSIVIDVKNTVASASVNVQSYTSNPLTTSAAAKVYQYLQITKGNIADSDTSKITISFKVPKSWLTSNNVGESDVVLYRYADSKWNGLPTSKTGSDANNVLYESTTPGFSTFAVGSKEAAPAVAPPAEAPPTEAPAPTGEVAAEVPKEEAPPEVKKPALSRTAIAWIVVLVIVVVAAIGYFMWQKKIER